MIDIYCSYIYSKDGTRDGEPLRYGQVFYLTTMDNEGGNVSIEIILYQKFFIKVFCQ